MSAALARRLLLAPSRAVRILEVRLTVCGAERLDAGSPRKRRGNQRRRPSRRAQKPKLDISMHPASKTGAIARVIPVSSDPEQA